MTHNTESSMVMKILKTRASSTALLDSPSIREKPSLAFRLSNLSQRKIMVSAELDKLDIELKISEN